MNLKKLKLAEKMFFSRYPGGYDNPEIRAISDKHKIEKMIELVLEYFGKKNFNDPVLIVENIAKIITRSSLVSVFEKVKFRDFIYTLEISERYKLSAGLKDMLFGDQRRGFESMVEVLQSGNMAKWPILTVIPNYYYPEKEVFIKPTTAKGVIEHFELKDIKYSPKPSWEFYEKYRAVIMDMKSKVGSGITRNNAGFCGFLMSSIE